MFLDGRSFDRQTLDADLCIVGAGAAGIALACAFIGSGLTVVVLESGGFAFDPATQSLYEGDNVSFNNFALETTRLRFFGGTTNHWGGMCARLSAFDLAARPGIPHTGWPIGPGDLAPWYPRAEALCQLGEVNYEDVAGWQRRAGFPSLALPEGPLVAGIAVGSPPTRFGSVYREPLAGATDVRVLLNANAQEIVADDDAAHVRHIAVQCIDGPRFAVRARRFVLAMGGLETARLLLLSRRQQPAGLANGHDLVGRFYMDHPGLSGMRLRLSPGSPGLGFFVDDRAVGDGRIYPIFIPTKQTLEREQLGNFRMVIGSAPGPAPGIESAEALAQMLAGRERAADLGRHLANVLVDLDDVADLAYRNLVNPKGTLTGRPRSQVAAMATDATLSAEQFPSPDSRVMLSSQTDLLGQPRILLDWRLQERDLRTMRRAAELFAAAMAGAGLGRLSIPREVRTGDFRSMVSIASHHMGTTRMSDDPRQGVVDSDLRVHGVDNLFIASSSTFPTGSWVNPTLTIVALALRLADHLKRMPT